MDFDIMSLNRIKSMIFFLSRSVAFLRCSISLVKAFTPPFVRSFWYTASFFSLVTLSLSYRRPLFDLLSSLLLFSSSLILFLISPISTSSWKRFSCRPWFSLLMFWLMLSSFWYASFLRWSSFYLFLNWISSFWSLLFKLSMSSSFCFLSSWSSSMFLPFFAMSCSKFCFWASNSLVFLSNLTWSSPSLSIWCCFFWFSSFSFARSISNLWIFWLRVVLLSSRSSICSFFYSISFSSSSCFLIMLATVLSWPRESPEPCSTILCSLAISSLRP